MQIDVLASGSTGNCYIIAADGLPPLLLDVGIPLAKIQKGCGYRLGDLAGCLITHGHGDHVKSAADLIRRGVCVYASRQTIDDCDLGDGYTVEVKPHKSFIIGGYSVYPFDAEHDAPGTLGYVISGGGEKLMYLTDSFYCKYKFLGLTHMMVECNYIDAALKENIAAGVIAKPRADRLYGSHMSLEHLMQMLSVTDMSKLKKIYLLHLSEENSDEKLMADAVKSMTGIEVYVAQKHGGVK